MRRYASMVMGLIASIICWCSVSYNLLRIAKRSQDDWKNDATALFRGMASRPCMRTDRFSLTPLLSHQSI